MEHRRELVHRVVPHRDDDGDKKEMKMTIKSYLSFDDHNPPLSSSTACFLLLFFLKKLEYDSVHKVQILDAIYDL